MKRIYVGNLSLDANEDSVRSIFETYGTVERVNIASDRDTGQAKAFGFVEMSDDTEADEAILKLNDSELDGRKLNVLQAQPGDWDGGRFRRRRNAIFKTRSRNDR